MIDIIINIEAEKMARFTLMKIYHKFDIFGQGVQFKVAGRETVTSCMGATISLLITFVTIAYAWTRFDLLL